MNSLKIYIVSNNLDENLEHFSEVNKDDIGETELQTTKCLQIGIILFQEQLFSFEFFKNKESQTELKGIVKTSRHGI